MEAGPIESYLKKDETEEFEPYDRRLHDRVSSLYAELESETLKVTQLRREAPLKAARIYEDQLKKEFDSDQGILKELARKSEANQKAGDLGIRQLERKDSVEEDYAKSAEILKALQSVCFYVFGWEGG